MSNQIVFLEPGKLIIDSFDLPVCLQRNELRVKSVCSLMSTGTENIIYNGLYDKGTHWDHYAKFPFKPGYSVIGEVIEVGSEVNRFKIGDRVAIRKNHSSDFVIDQDACMPVPNDIKPEHAVWFGLAKIAYSGVKVCHYALGQQVIIIGAGPIGQMSIRWAKAAGVKKIVVIDPQEKRLVHAKNGGAHFCTSRSIHLVKDEIFDFFDKQEADIVIDTTGVASVFQEALILCKKFGKLIILGDTGSPASQQLSSEVIQKGIQIIGAHDCHVKTNEPYEIFFSMIQDGRFNLDGLNTHYFSIEEGEDAYNLVNTIRGETMGVVFKYTL